MKIDYFIRFCSRYKNRITRPITCLNSLLPVAREKIRQHSILWILVKSFKKSIYFVGWFCFLPLAITGHILGFRRINVHCDRIGHLTAEIDCFEKERRLGLLQSKRYWFVLAPRARVANQYLINYWKDVIPVISNPILCAIIQILSLKWFMVHDVSSYILAVDKSARYYKVNTLWDNTPPLLKLTSEDNIKLRELLLNLGIPPNSWFVCFHCREPGFSPIDEIIHSHRNADIDSFLPAMEYVVKNGGWCIRMGDPTMKPIIETEGIINYAHSNYRSDMADVLLCAGCDYFVGTSSGLWILSSIFGKPCALSNMIPVSTLGYSPLDISIPKRLINKNTHKTLPYPEIFNSKIANYRISQQYKDANLEIVENTPDEILELTKEISNKTFLPAEIQNDDFLKLLKDGDYSFGATSRTSRYYINKHNDLF